MLPPPRSKNAGALQPPATRRLITPLPPRPPTIKPALMTPGNTATASALSSRSRGIDLSRAFMIWLKTRAALADRSAARAALPLPPFAWEAPPRSPGLGALTGGGTGVGVGVAFAIKKE